MDELRDKAKQAVLKEIMELMDSNMLGDLKSQSPKLMKIEVASAKPEESSMDELKAKLMGEADPDAEEDSHESPSEHDDDEERLKELYEKLK